MTVNSTLNDCAIIRSSEIIGTFSHTRPNGEDYWKLAPDDIWGENLGKVYNTGKEVVDAWIGSPTSNSYLLDTSFTTIGVGVTKAPNGNYYYCALFGQHTN